ncbi:hypothetical protein LCGC14_1263400 [marine sediment metagenome]|uniref:Uncharacterized protein n=1 Tax=marine sediment metagenome TaxID=412755 RepID=A0A0F9KZZ9_9ZZZZ
MTDKDTEIIELMNRKMEIVTGYTNSSELNTEDTIKIAEINAKVIKLFEEKKQEQIKTSIIYETQQLIDLKDYLKQFRNSREYATEAEKSSIEHVLSMVYEKILCL